MMCGLQNTKMNEAELAWGAEDKVVSHRFSIGPKIPFVTYYLFNDNAWEKGGGRDGNAIA